jgi:hypothetical protein
MSPRSSSETATGAGPSVLARRWLRAAWVAVVLIPAGFVGGTLVGEGLLSLRGHDSGAEQSPPLNVVVTSAAPAMLILLLPAVAAIVFGIKARNRGARNGVVPAVIGIVVGAYSLLANFLPLILGSWSTP